MSYILRKSLSSLLAGALILGSTYAMAELKALDDETLAKANGQNGILLDNEVQLNRSQNADGSIGDNITCDIGGTDCEFALRFDGEDKWLVIYDFSGGLHIKNLKLAATTTDGTTNGLPALELGDTSGSITATAEIDNYGGSSWAVVGDIGDIPGYRAPITTGAPGTLNEGKPRGFWDLRINGTLSMTGGLKIFNCQGQGIPGC